jgi:hypothetical protein
MEVGGFAAFYEIFFFSLTEMEASKVSLKA